MLKLRPVKPLTDSELDGMNFAVFEELAGESTEWFDDSQWGGYRPMQSASTALEQLLESDINDMNSSTAINTLASLVGGSEWRRQLTTAYTWMVASVAETGIAAELDNRFFSALGMASTVAASLYAMSVEGRQPGSKIFFKHIRSGAQRAKVRLREINPARLSQEDAKLYANPADIEFALALLPRF